MTTPKDERREPPTAAAERATLQGYLDFHRDTLMWKCAELSDEQLRARPLASTNLSLLGLVRHLADVERSWFRRRIAGEDAPPIFYTDAEPDLDIDPPADADPAADLETWRLEAAACDAAVADRDLDDTFVPQPGETLSVRWVYVHMIEEYARHNGHADLLREAIDGATGE
jgi:uncharacterized damage-inducible protein DinB